MTTTLQATSAPEMIQRYDAFLEEAAAVEGFPRAIHKEIAEGQTTGNKLIDLVIMRSGLYVPDIVRNYAPVEDRLKQAVGKTALVIVREQYQKYDDSHDYVWKPFGGWVSLRSGNLVEPAPIINEDELSWALPTDGYRQQEIGNRGYGGYYYVDEFSDVIRVPNSVEGALPVDDILSKPKDAGHNSTLGGAREQEKGKYSIGDPESGYSPSLSSVRLLKTTTLVIGGKEAQILIDKHRESYSRLYRESRIERERFSRLLTELAIS